MYEKSWKSLDSRPIPKWFGDDKFGIFIHWGVYSVPSWRGLENALFGSYAEWYYASVYGKYRNHDENFHKEHYGEDFEYRDFAKSFNAELFDSDKWAKLFRSAGARYVVVTSKHHDGYCLWPTENQHKKNWRVTDVGPKIDLLGSLKNSFDKENLKMGLYYSIIEWETNRSHRVNGEHFIPQKDVNKYGISEDDYPNEILIPQLKELVNNYHPTLIFSDGGEWDLSEEYTQTKDFLAWLYNESPVKDEVVVNDRFFKGMPGNHGDYYSTEYNDVDGFINHPWEESRGIGQSYGYNRAEDASSYNTFESLIKILVDVVSKGGNFLLNVGPTADGRIPEIQEERLLQIGKWMDINSESIYSTKSGLNYVKNYDSTVKENNIYVFVFDVDNYINIKLEKDCKVNRIKILGLDKEIKFEQREKDLDIDIPSEDIYKNLLLKNIDFETYVLKLEVENDKK